MSTSKPSKGIPVASKIPTSGRDSGTHSRSSSVSNLTTASDIHSEVGDAMSENTHGFKIDDRVWVNGTKPGHIKFLGKTEFAPGLWAGILLDDPVGKNDGSVGGVQYFSCQPLRGVFARPSKLCRSSGGLVSGTGDTTGTKAATPRAAGASTPLSSRLAGSTASLSSCHRGVCSKLRCGERVMVSSTSGMKPGILRYLGETEFAKGEWAGIELDEPVGKNDGSVAGKRYFTCKMKYGLFSPLHKVSRAGGTSTPRTPSVRGTPLMRSSSRDSLSSSVSNSSKLKARTTGGIGIMTTSRALEEALKEKEQHIEQLLKEHDMERTEIAKVASRCEELEIKCNTLLDHQERIENSKKDVEQQLNTEKRKIEDLQFQLEEERIVRSDLEVQMSNNKKTLHRLGEFLNNKMDNKFINIKEILEGQENLTVVSEDKAEDPQTEVYKEKIACLEASLASNITENDEHKKKLEELRLSLNASQNENQNLQSSLNTTIQEKDDVISNLKTELNSQLEKLTKIIEDNKELNEQINLQAAEAKGQTDEVIKEMGEKIKTLSEELKVKSNQLQECETSLQEKDSKLLSNSEILLTQEQQITEIKSQKATLQEGLEQKTCELNDNKVIQKSLEDEIAALKLQFNTQISEKEEKILCLVKELESLTNNLQEKEDNFAHKQDEVSRLEEEMKKLTDTNYQIQIKVKEAEEQLLFANKDGSEKVTSLQTEINMLKEENEKATDKLKKELETLHTDSEKLSQNLAEKTAALAERESQISSLTQTLNEKESEVLKLQSELVNAKETCGALNEEKTQFINSLKTKEESLTELDKQLNSLKDAAERRNQELLATQAKLESLQDDLKGKNEENTQLKSKLQLAEQNVEMLNKDSSQHVMTLQNELSKLKEENVKNKTDYDQIIADLQNENKKACKEIEENKAHLTQKEEALSTFKQDMTIKENDVSNLTVQIEKLEKEITVLSQSKDNLQASSDKKLLELNAKFEGELKLKEQEMSKIKEECDKLSLTISEKSSSLMQKEEELLNLQKQMKEKENIINDSSALIDNLKHEMESLIKDNTNSIAEKEKQIQACKEEFDVDLKKKDQHIMECQTEVSKVNELLKSKDEELHQKGKDSNELKETLQERESKINDLTSALESLESKLKQLSEQEDSKTKVLADKEAFINDFKAVKEKEVLELEEKYKAETSKLQELLQRKENNVNEKSDLILKLNNEAETRIKEITHLSDELAKNKEMNEKILLNSGETNKDLTNKIADLEKKLFEMSEEKKRIEIEEQKSKEAKKSLEESKNSLLQEKLKKEEIVKDKEEKLEALQAEVKRMQEDFTLHKQDLQKKLDISEMELQAAQELKNQLELQHSVLEELQQDLHNSDEKCKNLEAQLGNMSILTSEKAELLKKLDELEKSDQEKSKKITDITDKFQTVEEALKDNQISLQSKEEECISLSEKLKVLQKEKESKELLKKSMKSLEQDNILLKHQIEKLEKSSSQKNANDLGDGTNQTDTDDERATLMSQVDFLNSIIVDMKQKNENLQLKIEALEMGPVDIDANLNSVEKKIAPRMFCDICDVFDLHETDDCPKQESFIADEDVPHLIPQGSRTLEERPYCNTCEIFGHWTYDCQEEDEY